MTHDESGPCNTCEGTGKIWKFDLAIDATREADCDDCGGAGVRDYQVWAGE